MKAVSVYKKFSYVKDLSLKEMISKIKTGEYKEQIIQIRECMQKGEEDKADRLKAALPAFTASGTFVGRRIAKNLNQYSGYLILDLDHINKAAYKEKWDLVCLAPYTYFAFRSPRGEGIKILVPVNSGPEVHKIAFEQVVKYYEQCLQLEIDTSGSDINRLCYVSYDENCFLKGNAEIFEVEITPEITKNSNKSIPENIVPTGNLIEDCVAFTENCISYQEGSRNNFIHQLACNTNRRGITEQEILEFCLQSYELPQREISNTINSAYKNNTADFAKFAKLASPAGNQEKENEEENLLNMPYLPDEVFDDLPEILKEGARVFKDRRERDVFLTSAIAILSGCLPCISGTYDGKEHSANLFSFVIAPAASGKGSITYAKDLAQQHHKRLVAESQEAYRNYQREEKEYKRKLADKKIDTANLEPPVEPPFKVLYIPANNSSARVIQQLHESENKGIFCETEADTMGNVLKQDWGGYSDLLRKAFHHESISYSRKTDKEWVEIEGPKLSICLAGTPSQVKSLIATAEDGLFSRFLFYTFKNEIKWREIGPTSNGVNLTTHFSELGKQVLELIDFHETQADVTFELTEAQWAKLNVFGSKGLNYLATFISEDLSSTSKRLGLILYRIAMVFTVLRYYENAEVSLNYTCEDRDFDNALKLVEVYQEHAVTIFKNLPKESAITNTAMKNFYLKLPVKFKRKEAIKLAEKMGIKERTADYYLSKLTKTCFLKKEKEGVYEKESHNI